MSWPVYLLKMNAAIIVCWAVYRIAFRQLTFFQWNRIFLPGSVILAAILPLIRFASGPRILTSVDLTGFDWSYVDHLVGSSSLTGIDSGTIRPGSLLLVLYLTVSLSLMAVSLHRFLILCKRLRHARKIRDGKVKLFLLDNHAGSFTLFRRIYLDQHAYNHQFTPVLNHEMIHAVQLHTIDLLFMELVANLLWFNPIVLLIKRCTRENHEFLADAPAGTSKDSLLEYLECLRTETIRKNAPGMASFFKNSTIKKRIIMLTNHHSNSRAKWRYLAVLPVIAVLTVAFQVPGPSTGETPGTVSGGMYSMDGIPSIFPLPDQYLDRITWRFNEKAIHPVSKKETVHQGIDIAAPLGTPVVATAGGTVIKAANLTGWGNFVLVEHSDGYATVYAHMETLRVSPGETVRKGALLGTVGNTGQSTGPHLHYEVLKGDRHVNPSDYY